MDFFLFELQLNRVSGSHRRLLKNYLLVFGREVGLWRGFNVIQFVDTLVDFALEHVAFADKRIVNSDIISFIH